VIAMSMVLAASSVACASEGDMPESSGSDDPKATVPEALAVRFDEVPDNPALLGSCNETDDEQDRYTPARWLPTVLPDGSSVRFASHRLPAGADFDPGWSSVLVGTDDAGEVTTALQVTATFGQGGIAGEPPKERLRGVPGMIFPSSDRGSGGAFEAMWGENDVVWRAVAWGLDEEGLRATIERGAFEPDGVIDPTGELTTLTRGALSFRPVTEIDLSEPGATGARQDVVVIAEPVEGGAGPLLDYTGSVMGMQLSSIDGRPALRSAPVDERTGTSETDMPVINSVLTTIADGSPISVTGAFTIDELETVVRSTERVAPDDDRLIGIPMTFPLDESILAVTPFCRTDR